MKKAGIFFAPGFEEIEALTVVDLLRRVNIEAECIAINNEKTVTGSHNITVVMDKGISETDFAATAVLLASSVSNPRSLM